MGEDGLQDGPQGPKGDKGDTGAQGEPGEAILVPLAQEMVKQLVDGAAWSQKAIATLNKTVHLLKKTIIGLIAVAVVLATVVGYLGYKDATHPLSNQLHSQVTQNQDTIKNVEQYVRTYAQHGCQSLSIVAASLPSVPPANPTANPSREDSYKLYQAIVHWEVLDGCKITVVPVNP